MKRKLTPPVVALVIGAAIAISASGGGAEPSAVGVLRGTAHQLGETSPQHIVVQGRAPRNRTPIGRGVSDATPVVPVSAEGSFTISGYPLRPGTTPPRGHHLLVNIDPSTGRVLDLSLRP